MEAGMKSRLTLVVCCFLTSLLIGVWLGQLLPSGSEAFVDRPTVSALNSDGWQLAAGQQSGPTATLRAETVPDEPTHSARVGDPAPGFTVESADHISEPDIAYFPDAIVGVARESGSQSPTDSTTLFQESPGSNSEPAALSENEAAVWKAELKNLPPGQAEDILNLRKQLGSVASESLGVLFPAVSDPAVEAPALFPSLADDEARPIPRSTSSAVPWQVRLASARDDPPVLKTLRSEAAVNYRENLANARTLGFKRKQIVLLNVSIADSHPSQQHSNEITHTSAEVELLPAPASRNEDPIPAAPPLATAAAEPAPSVEHVESESVHWLSRLDLRQGELVSTSNPLDLALDGPGWLTVERDGHHEFVRTGMLGFDDSDRLGIQTGAGLLPIVPAVQLPKDQQRIVITDFGEVLILTAAGAQTEVGTLQSVDFRNASALQRTSVGTYAATEESGTAVATRPSSARFLQGVLEASNVDADQEMADLNHIHTVVEKIAQAGPIAESP
jgi:flagellar basal body rod protein FlgG